MANTTRSTDANLTSNVMQALKQEAKALTGTAPDPLFQSNLDVEFVISFRYSSAGKAAVTGDDVPPEKQLEKLLHVLDLAGLRTTVRDGGNGTLLIFTRIRSERKLMGEVYRSR
jgi:anoctamin-10